MVKSITWILVVISLVWTLMSEKVMARSKKLRVCVGEFPTYAIALDYLLQNKQHYDVSISTVHACSVRYKKNYFDLVLADSYIFVTNYLDDADNSIVSLVNYSDGIDQIIGQKGKTAAALQGSRWALQRGTMSTVLLSFYLKSRQLSLRDVVLEDVKVENTPQAIGRGRFQGVVNWQPYAREALERGGELLATSADFQDKLFDFVVTRRSAIHGHRALIQAYLQERLRRAQNMEQVYAAYARKKQVSAPQAAADFAGIFIYRTAAEVRRDQLRVLQSLRIAAEVADISQYSGRHIQELLKLREAEIFDLSLIE